MRRPFRTQHYQFWLLMALPLLYLIIFHYIPLGGLVLAFKNYNARLGIFHSPNVGLTYFKQFLATPSSQRIIRNTFTLGFYSLLVGFPFPILLAVMLNEVRSKFYKKTVQMVTYAPYFISTVVMVGMLMQLFDLRNGIVNRLVVACGGNAINYFGKPELFSHLYVWSGVWQGAGYASIIYIAALSSVPPELKEAAIVDGASNFRRIWHVDLPCIASTIVMMLIFNIGAIMNIGFEKVYLMQNPANTSVSEIISTFVYRIGLKGGNYGFSTAVGLFNSLLSLVLFLIANQLSRRYSDTSIW
ncbi:MAG: ABC transporter permease subunit [Eubacteriales bacterium]|nr:ABC transporter permease subunit [Eubacteriales bacterium]